MDSLIWKNVEDMDLQQLDYCIAILEGVDIHAAAKAFGCLATVSSSIRMAEKYLMLGRVMLFNGTNEQPGNHFVWSACAMRESDYSYPEEEEQCGSTPAEAICRAYVRKKFGVGTLVPAAEPTP